MSLSEVANGMRVDVLRALRDRLASEIDNCKASRDVAALANRFQEVLREIDELDPPKAVKVQTPLDELMKRREAKKTG